MRASEPWFWESLWDIYIPAIYESRTEALCHSGGGTWWYISLMHKPQPSMLLLLCNSSVLQRVGWHMKLYDGMHGIQLPPRPYNHDFCLACTAMGMAWLGVGHSWGKPVFHFASIKRERKAKYKNKNYRNAKADHAARATAKPAGQYTAQGALFWLCTCTERIQYYMY